MNFERLILREIQQNSVNVKLLGSTSKAGGLLHLVKEQIFDEFGKIPYRRTDRGYALWPKDQMKQKGIQSPVVYT